MVARVNVAFLMMLVSLVACLAADTGDPPTPPRVNRVSTSAPVVQSPSPGPSATFTQPPTPSPPPAALPSGLGTVTGRLCYPSYLPPPMVLYFQNTATGEEVKVEIPQGQETFSLELPSGEYVASAQTVGTALAGTYSEAVICGLKPGCTDHQLRPFPVEAGQLTPDIDLCDWYLPPGVISGAGATIEPGLVSITTLQNMDIYTSPTLSYPPLEIVPPLTSAQALARTADLLWLRVAYPVRQTSWLYAPLLRIIGQPERLPVVTQTLTLETREPPQSPEDQPQFIPASRWPASPNADVVHFKGTIKDIAGRPVNGFSILLENGTWSVLSHPTGASHHYPDVSEGSWDLIIYNATDATGWWVLTVISYDCPGFEEGFDAQCKQFTRLSEPQVVKIVYPERTILQADWICQQGCDQGLYQEPYRP